MEREVTYRDKTLDYLASPLKYSTNRGNHNNIFLDFCLIWNSITCM